MIIDWWRNLIHSINKTAARGAAIDRRVLFFFCCHKISLNFPSIQTMSWVSDYQYTFLQKVVFRALQQTGHIPHHIAFVMDGNRRFARSKQIDKIEGHSRGFAKLADVLRWCLDMGIREVTTFAFSIENFKRSNEEVEGLFNLAREKFNKLLAETSRMDEHGIRIRVIGNIELLPQDLQRLIATAMLRTESNDKLFLNIAFSYTSHDEITQAIETVLTAGADADVDTKRTESGDDSLLLPSDITERLLEACLYTRNSSPPDLVFRTSGETRLSDFLMWQVGCLRITLGSTFLHLSLSISLADSHVCAVLHGSSVAPDHHLELHGQHCCLSARQVPPGDVQTTGAGT